MTSPDNDSSENRPPLSHRDLCLADHAGCLDPSHPVNAAFREAGHGSVPHVQSVNVEGKFATVLLRTVAATARVPFGWHVVEDERRALVFDGDTRAQLSLSVLEAPDATVQELVESLLAEVRDEHPQAQYFPVQFDDVPGVALRGFEIDGRPVNQAFMFRAVAGAWFLVARLTSGETEFGPALDLTELVLRDLRFTA